MLIEGPPHGSGLDLVSGMFAMNTPTELPLVSSAAAEAVTGAAPGVDLVAGQQTDAVAGLGERMLGKLTQLARFGLTAGQPLFRASARSA